MYVGGNFLFVRCLDDKKFSSFNFIDYIVAAFLRLLYTRVTCIPRNFRGLFCTRMGRQISHLLESLSFTITGGAARRKQVAPKTWRILTPLP